jgi:hypothetical protein
MPKLMRSRHRHGRADTEQTAYKLRARSSPANCDPEILTDRNFIVSTRDREYTPLGSNQ